MCFVAILGFIFKERQPPESNWFGIYDFLKPQARTNNYHFPSSKPEKIRSNGLYLPASSLKAMNRRNPKDDGRY